ncbi:UDP-N-acetylmuramoylalanyl-D-glutamyl-2, 6-diaminopimelate--D-alanyl-D-alanine ligase, partial [Xanthomonas campestris pv. campestris]|nr:UDP-N-acetylmuramoylalanyl-D-glutamyl-2, 6-diaminopimelate--D-alanyl-D-alanine ligase [Xanthomonas campestris pv. campestris]
FGDGRPVCSPPHAALAAALQADLAAAASQTQTQDSSLMHEHAGAVARAAASVAPPTLLVKGSRGSAMDRIVAALLAPSEDASHVA